MPRKKDGNDIAFQQYAENVERTSNVAATPIPGIDQPVANQGTSMTGEDAAALIEKMKEGMPNTSRNFNVNPQTNNGQDNQQRPYGQVLEEAQEAKRKEVLDEIHQNGLGYLPIDVKDLPTKGIFYPEGTRLFIRAATGGEIRHWSQTNETELTEIDDSLNYMLERCLSIRIPGKIGDWKDLKEIDRFYVILAIRDFSFPDGNNELMIKITETQQTPLKKDNIDFIKFEDKIMKFYDVENRCFTIQNFTSKQGRVINLKKPLHIYMPSVGVNNWLKNYMNKKARQQEMFDQDFLKMAPLLLPDYRGLNDDSYKAFIETCDYFGTAEYSIIEQFRRVLTMASNPQFIYTDKEGMEQRAPLNFQGGIKSLFLYSVDELI